VRRSRLFDFLDRDGTYALIRPLDDTRGRVVYSTLHEEGEILYKDPRLTWDEAGQEAGGSTRMAPSGFPLCSPKDGDLDAEDFHGREEERVLFDLLEADEAPEAESHRPSPYQEILQHEGKGRPPDLLMHLVVHYLRLTEPGQSDGRWGRVCSCTGIRPHRSVARALGSAISNALRWRGLPSLNRIISALHAVQAKEVSSA
jgi:hypothetical protein